MSVGPVAMFASPFADRQQFLDSIISSIGDGKGPSPVPGTALTNRPTAPRSADQRTPSAAASLKRKADESSTPTNVPSKVSKLAGHTSLAQSRSATSSPGQRTIATTSKASTRSPAPTGPPKPTGAVPGAKPAPAKTGYLAVLERAKAAQEAAKQIGQIKHHKTERLSRRERERLQAEAASKDKSAVSKDGRSESRPAKANAGVSREEDSKKVRKPVDVGYRGTIRPTGPHQSAYRGTMGRAAVSSRAGPPSSAYGRHLEGNRTRNRYEDEDEDEIEEEEDYQSDASSVMEAGWDDVAKEEMASALLAKKEDEAAAEEEEALRRRKLERQKKLQALQDAAAKKKRVY